MGVRLYPGTAISQDSLNAGHGRLDPANPHLHGVLTDNDDLVEPVFYLSAALGDHAVSPDEQRTASEAEGRRLAGGDRRSARWTTCES